MVSDCEHTEGSPMGKCAVCEQVVCSECFTELFGETICGNHKDDSAWAAIGFYTDTAVVERIRYDLQDKEIESIAVAGDEDAVELYVPLAEKEHAYAALVSGPEDGVLCEECTVQYPSGAEVCPVCGKA